MADDQTAAIQGQLDEIPDGTEGNPTIVTMARGTYRVDGALTLAEKSHVDLWLHGVTFQATIDGSPYDARRHFTIDACDDITIRGLTIRGASPVAGTQNAAYVVDKEFQHGFRIYNGSTNILLTHCNVFDIWGDFVYVGAGAANDNIRVRKGEFRRNGRQAFAVIEGSNIFFEDNVLSDIRRSFVDVEPNVAEQSVDGVWVLRNVLETSTAGSGGEGFTAQPNRLSFFANKGPDSDTSNIYFEDNVSAGNFNGESGKVAQTRTNLVFRRNVFASQHGNPTGGALQATNWAGIEFTDNVIPLQTRTPVMYVCLHSADCTGLVESGNTITPGGAGVFNEVEA